MQIFLTLEPGTRTPLHITCSSEAVVCEARACLATGRSTLTVDTSEGSFTYTHDSITKNATEVPGGKTRTLFSLLGGGNLHFAICIFCCVIGLAGL